VGVVLVIVLNFSSNFILSSSLHQTAVAELEGTTTMLTIKTEKPLKHFHGDLLQNFQNLGLALESTRKNLHGSFILVFVQVLYLGF
jgi:hypothetical protein